MKQNYENLEPVVNLSRVEQRSCTKMKQESENYINSAYQSNSKCNDIPKISNEKKPYIEPSVVMIPEEALNINFFADCPGIYMFSPAPNKDGKEN